MFTAASSAVTVLITLPRTPDAGGHVKIWERLAEAAADLPDWQVALTVYFLASPTMPAGRTEVLSDKVRLKAVSPRFSTARIPFLRQGAGDTDLAGWNVALARALMTDSQTYDGRHVVHVTDTFAFARTATKLAQRHRWPIVYSLHTDYPRFTQIYTREAVENLFGQSWMSRLLIDRWHFDDQMAAGAGQRP